MSPECCLAIHQRPWSPCISRPSTLYSFDVRCACGSTTFHALLQHPLLGLVEGTDSCGGTSSVYAVRDGWRKFELCLITLYTSIQFTTEDRERNSRLYRVARLYSAGINCLQARGDSLFMPPTRFDLPKEKRKDSRGLTAFQIAKSDFSLH
ncbi:hypothetical protein CPC08DRAFT_71543 [Agrocybe pediades]|nr:hypothetical protein CPC08DRAFT_71543 [Agrocybe pediades]